MLKLFLVLGFVLAVVSCIGERADAAAANPRTKCDQKITWTVSDTYAPDNVQDTIRWAYQQVAAPTRTVAVDNVEQDINWEWQTSLSGGNYSPNQTYLDSSIFGEREFWTHSFDGDILEPDPVKVKQQVLRLVVGDFGVKAPTSTAAGLSVKDRDALKAICAQQAQAAGDAKDGKPKGHTKGDKADKADNTDSDESTGTPPPGGNADFIIILLLLAPLLAFLVFGPKVLAPLTRLRRLKPTKRRINHDGYDDEEAS